MRTRTIASLIALAATMLAHGGARAEGPVPAPTTIPQTLTLDDAVRIFRKTGIELLIADANVRSAEGAVKAAAAVPNPVVSGTLGYAYTFTPKDPSCQYTGPSLTPTNYVSCTNKVWSVSISDSAALEDTLSGKRDLRQKVARNALAAAKMSRVDAERTITMQVKTTYLAVAQAALALKFAKDVADANTTLLEKVHIWQAAGKTGITDADVARMETQKSESDQAVDTVVMTLRQARIALAFLIGARGEVPNFDVDAHVLDYRMPSSLAGATEVGLLRMAFAHRPDLVAAGYSMRAAEAQLALVRRQRFPDITMSLTYAEGGFGGSGTNAALQTPMFTFGLSAPIPAFYFLQGELRQAEAALDINSLQHAMVTKQVVSDIDTTYAAFTATQRLVNRMEKGDADKKIRPILESAKVALDITRLQWERGAASLTDFLIALQTYIATKVEYYGDLTNFWTAVYQLEAAVGTPLT